MPLPYGELDLPVRTSNSPLQEKKKIRKDVNYTKIYVSLRIILSFLAFNLPVSMSQLSLGNAYRSVLSRSFNVFGWFHWV